MIRFMLYRGFYFVSFNPNYTIVSGIIEAVLSIYRSNSLIILNLHDRCVINVMLETSINNIIFIAVYH